MKRFATPQRCSGLIFEMTQQVFYLEDTVFNGFVSHTTSTNEVSGDFTLIFCFPSSRKFLLSIHVSFTIVITLLLFLFMYWFGWHAARWPAIKMPVHIAVSVVQFKMYDDYFLVESKDKVCKGVLTATVARLNVLSCRTKSWIGSSTTCRTHVTFRNSTYWRSQTANHTT